MKKLTAFAVSVVSVTLGSGSAFAAYTRTTSAPVYISKIYTNEWGSPFVYIEGVLNNVCADGNGLYLYDITVTAPTQLQWELRKNKMAVLLSAKAIGKPVVLDYFYDTSAVSWDRCYINGITIQD